MAAVLDEARTFVQTVSDAPSPGVALIETGERTGYWCTDRNDSAKRVAFSILLKVFGERLRKREDVMRLSTDLQAMNAKGLFGCIQEYAPLSPIMEYAMLCPQANRDGIIDVVLDLALFELNRAFKKRNEVREPTSRELYLAASVTLPALHASHSRIKSAKERRRYDENDAGALHARI
ncbi:MAG: hypothetical protein P4M00_06285 [Azospirillaceae bacterium]|nr:hypothetical protein [Azospirillaceae bacterium]